MADRSGVPSRALLALWLAAVAGCASATGREDPDGGETDADAEDDPAGDPIDGDVTFEVDVALSEAIPTVATVAWSTSLEAPTSARIEVTLDGEPALEVTADVSGDGPYETLVFGMKPSRDYALRVVAESGGVEHASDEVAFTTGAAPAALPDLSVTVSEPGSAIAASGYIVTSIFAVPPAAVIIDGDGDYVWWHIDDETGFQPSRARLSPDSQWVYYWQTNIRGGGGPGGPGGGPGAEQAEQRLTRVSIDGTTVEELPLEDGHHDFTFLPDGTVAYIEYDIRTVGRASVEGDRIVELRPDGTSSIVWSVWDDVEYDGATVAAGTSWSHANQIAYAPDEDAYFVSFRSFDSIFKIDRADGEVLWIMGGALSDFTLPGGSTSITSCQHGLDPLGDTVLVFDNGDERRGYSQVLELGWDEDAGTAEILWSYAPSPSIYNFSLGSAERLAGGTTLVTYSNAGQLEEVTPEGEVVWRLNASLGGATGYAEYMERLQ